MKQRPSACNKTNELKFLVWNINGLADKLGEPDIQDRLKKYDVIALTETMKDERYDITFPGYCTYHFARQQKHAEAKRASGGILVMVSKMQAHNIKVSQAAEHIVWVTVNKDRHVGIVYIPPEGSRYNGNADYFEILETEVEAKMRHGRVFLCGDLNARTGDLPDFIQEENLYEYPPITTSRENPDKHVNKYGRKLIDFCVKSGNQILNGRKPYQRGTPTFTCFKYNGKSAIDYLITNAANAELIGDFTVGTGRPDSDHSPLSFILNGNLPRSQRPRTSKLTGRKYVWDINKQNEYIKSLKDPHNLHIFEDFLCKTIDVNSDHHVVIDGFYKYLTGSLDGIFRKNNPRPTCTFPVNPWFDLECKQLKAQLRQAISAQVSQETERDLKQKYKRVVQQKKRQYHSETADILHNMNSHCPNDYWQFWKRLKNNKAGNECIDLEKFTSYYKGQCEQVNITDGSTSNTFLDRISEIADGSDLGEYSYFYDPNLDAGIIDDILNGPITGDELEHALKRSKNKKACGLDGIATEFFKHSQGALKEPILALFNYIFNSGTYPDMWSMGIINPIYKQSEKCMPDNYRKITILPAVSKIFETTLNNRLRFCKTVLQTDDPLQNGFKEDARAVDNTFILNGIIEKYTAMKRPLYIAFIDFKSAFDHVNRKALLFKLKCQKVHGKFLNIIKSMLQKSQSCVRWNGVLGEIFDNLKGVLQGGVLSPSLFKIFMEDLPNFLDNGKGVKIGNMLISYLLHADDLVLISETSAGLQSLLNGLDRFCKRWDMIINSLKSNIMIFNKRYIYAQDILEFTINKDVIKQTDRYKYLGTVISNKKNIFCDNFSHLKGKALRAIGSLRSDVRKAVGSALPLHLYLKSFDAQIRPILDYGAEIWYQPKPVQEIESVQLGYLKRLLGVRQQTPTLAIFGETGRFPLHLRQQDQVIKYWKRLQHFDKNSILHKIYIELVDLDIQGFNTWVTRARSVLRSESEAETTINSMEPALYDCHPFFGKSPRYRKFVADWYLQINDSDLNPKLRTYKNFKSSFHYEPYLKFMTNKNHMKALTRFRTSSHNLGIEKGRHCKPVLPLEQRICKFCQGSPLDDEKHMLLHCTFHNDGRKDMLSSISRHVPLVLSEHVLFKTIMSHTHVDVIHALGKYLNNGFKERENSPNT